MYTERVALTDRVAFLLGKLGRVAVDRYAARLEPLGVRPPHCSVLDAIARRPGMSQQDLGRFLGQAPSGLVTVLDDLDRLGAIQRVRDETDRRRHVLALTPAGARLLAQAEALAMAVDEELLAALAPEQRETLARLLRRAAQGVGATPAA